MKNFLIFLMFIILIGCSSTKQVYWCGDHPCLNSKEKKNYFKEKMIVEVRSINKKEKKNISEIEKIREEFSLKEKNRIKNEKKLRKQNLVNEKMRIKEEKKLAKKAIKDEKKLLKKNKKIAKKISLEEKKLTKKNSKNNVINIDSKKLYNSDFSKIVEKIKNENLIKPYPDINRIK